MKKLRIVSDFNVANLVSLFAADGNEPAVEASAAPFGQVGRALARGEGGLELVWTLPGGVSGAYRKLARGEAVEAAELDEELERFCEGLAGLAASSEAVLCMAWIDPDPPAAYGSLAYRPGRGTKWALLRMNQRLAEAVDGLPNAVLLDPADWLRAAAETGSGDRLWYLSKTPFTRPVFERAVAACKRALRARAGRARKLLILDLDNTLWGGVLGDVGMEKIRLGGHDPVGEAFRDVQEEALRLSRLGVALGVASKNDEDYALECLRTHPEMRIRPDDLAGWRINWEDKAANIIALIAELNLGPDAAVFLDDNPAERSRVRQALPEVLVPELPEDPMRMPAFVRGLDCFDAVRITGEDQARAGMYTAERRRKETREAAGSLDDWLASLETEVGVRRLEPVDLVRTAQLLNKTNQMNLATRRMSESELEAWAAAEGHQVWTFRVSDRFGDAGLTGILGLDLSGAECEITDFVLSCRVMGRGVEEAMAAVAVEEAARQGKAVVVARYRATERNGPCLEFWKRSGFERDGDEFRLETDRPCDWPAWLERA